MRPASGALLGVALLAPLVGCSGPQPKQIIECGTSVRDPAATGSALVGKEYGVEMAPVPLDSVLFANKKLMKRVAVQGLYADRTEGDTVRVTARLVNCTKEPVRVAVRTHFMEKSHRPAEKPSAWQSVFVQPGSLGVYSESSVATASVESYLVELREPDQ